MSAAEDSNTGNWHVRHRAPDGQLLPESDPRVQAALRSFPFARDNISGHWDWRDAAELVNAVLQADDSFDHSARSSHRPKSNPDAL